MKIHERRSGRTKPADTGRHACALALGALFASMLALPAHAQSCTPMPQRVASTLSTTITGWTSADGDTTTNPSDTNWTSNALGSTGAQHWDDQGDTTIPAANLPTGFDTLTANTAPVKVSGGAVLQFDIAWNNAQQRNPPPSPPPWDGNQARMVVSYGGTQYFELLTSSYVGSGTRAAPGPTTGSAINALNGATLLSGTMPAPTNVAGAVTMVWSTVRIQLPDNIAQTGALVIGAQRMQNNPVDRSTDDVYVRNLTIENRTLCLRKATPNGAGNFQFTTTNLDANQTTAGNQNGPLAMNTVDATPVAMPDADTSVAGTQPALVMANGVSVTETTLAAGYGMTGISCDNGVTGSIGGTAAVPVATLSSIPAGTQVTCTITNTHPRIRLQKTLPAGRAQAGDQFALVIAGPRGGGATTATATTTGTGSTASGTADFNPADAGGSYVLSETAAGTTVPGAYASSYSCTNATAGSPTAMPSGSGTSFNLAPAAADDITCTFSNAPSLSDLSLTKTNTPAAGPTDQAGDTVTRGAAVNYSIVVSNAGPQPANGAVLRDPAPTGVTCAAASCSASGGATCPAPASLTVANLQSAAGVAIPSMPSGGSLTVSLTCTAN
ncbi:DUF11 domain-containing protein [Luteimonas aquatica]|uniref:DUF11 domain-containing protein n=1 Tax=Luteimonas aquatica TaxID=450364 RepID=UPI001F58C72F|nr:DUF11 domain-containing protein [Luteimonas aquatica]